MVAIIISATVLNYGLFSFLNGYFNTVENTYNTAQMNMIFCVVVIGVAIFIMFILIPKETVDNVILDIDETKRTPEQELQDMIDEELEN
jgi:prolipoprotein diacylglyceryltransferase